MQSHLSFFGSIICLSVGTTSVALAETVNGNQPATTLVPAPSGTVVVVQNPSQSPLAVYVVQPAPVPFKHVSITLNPLSIILLRASVNVEYLPVRHHAIMLNPSFQAISVGDDSSKSEYMTFGGELSYHYYTGTKGANGFFFGPSFLGGRYQVRNSGNGENSTNGLNYIGGAFDIGGQHVFDNGFTIGGGGGIMYIAANTTSSDRTSTLVRLKGTMPRFLFMIGYSF